MGNSEQELTKKPKTNSKTGRKRAVTINRNPGSKAGRKPRPKPKKKPRPGQGGTLLRSSLDIEVGKQSVDIAKALVTRMIAGDKDVTRLIFEATGAKTPAGPPPKKRHGPTLAQQLAMDEQWEEPDEGDGDIGAPALDAAV